MNDTQCPTCMLAIPHPILEHVNVWHCDNCGTLIVGGGLDQSRRYRVTADVQMSRMGQCRNILNEWVSKQGHDRCWYYPDLFRELCKVLCVEVPADTGLPSREEFEAGCRRYQDEEYGE